MIGIVASAARGHNNETDQGSACGTQAIHCDATRIRALIQTHSKSKG